MLRTVSQRFMSRYILFLILHKIVACLIYCHFFRAIAIRQKHTLPDLPYDYNALEPVISAEIMVLHHSKHHQAYVNMLNQAEEKFMEAKEKSTCFYHMNPL